jgi:hypothetical protein
MAAAVRTKLAALGAAFALASCGGGGGGALPSGPTAHGAAAALTFFIPAPSSPAAHQRRPAYLPSTTQSIVVTVTNADGTPLSPPIAPIVTNVGPTSPACSSAGGGLQCTVNVNVPQGALLFFVAAYAGANGGGAVLSSGSTTSTIGTGPNSVAVTLSNVAQYVGSNVTGQSAQIVSIDHEANTFSTSNVDGSGASSGTFTTLPNGDLKATITASTNGTPIGAIAYVKENAGGAASYIATNSASPNADGSATGGDFGNLVALSPCLTSGSFPINIVTVAGPSWSSAPASNQAYAYGTVTITSGELVASGNSFTISGTALSSSPSSPVSCQNGVWGGGANSSAMFDPQGAVVVADGTSNGSSPNQTGNLGFRAPSAPLSLSDIAAQSYEAFSGGSTTVSGSTVVYETPFSASPSGSGSLTACPYTNFEADTVSTANCSTVTLTSQPFPGLILGTATDSSGSSQFAAAAGQVNGKYVLYVFSVSTGGQPLNLTLMQR